MLKKSISLAIVFVASMACIATAQAAKLAEVFNGRMLGTTQRYFESIAGIPVRKFGGTYQFDIEGCEVQASIENEEVYALRLELTPRCHVDLTSFALEGSTRGLTFGKFPSARYFSDCLALCGNAADPLVYAFWEGSRIMGSLEVLLEAVQMGDSVLDAANKWREPMFQQMGDDYVIGLRFNCEDRFSHVAAQAFENVEVEAITLGYGLSPNFRCK